MRRHILVFGLAGGALVAALRALEYRYLVIDRSVEIYGGIVALIFAATGVWLGRRVTGSRERLVIREVPVPAASSPQPFRVDERRLAELGLTPRELEILRLIAEGLSNREIAERSFISENTVKTHSGRVFGKLGVKRRVQAVQRGRELGLIP